LAETAGGRGAALDAMLVVRIQVLTGSRY